MASKASAAYRSLFMGQPAPNDNEQAGGDVEASPSLLELWEKYLPPRWTACIVKPIYLSRTTAEGGENRYIGYGSDKQPCFCCRIRLNQERMTTVLGTEHNWDDSREIFSWRLEDDTWLQCRVSSSVFKLPACQYGLVESMP